MIISLQESKNKLRTLYHRGVARTLTHEIRVKRPALSLHIPLRASKLGQTGLYRGEACLCQGEGSFPLDACKLFVLLRQNGFFFFFFFSLTSFSFHSPTYRNGMGPKMRSGGRGPCNCKAFVHPTVMLLLTELGKVGYSH